MDSSRLHPGEKPRYRLELQNTGTLDVVFYENPSFVKTGLHSGENSYEAVLTLPSGQETVLPPPILAFGLPSHLGRQDAASTELSLRLHPGESLVTRGAAPDGFRDLATAYEFDRPGAYGIRFSYDKRLTTGIHSESNKATFEITR